MIFAQETLASTSRGGYAGNGQITVFSTVSIFWPFGITAEVVAVQLNEVEGVEEHAVVSAVVTNEVKRGNAIKKTFSTRDGQPDQWMRDQSGIGRNRNQ
jgi:nanoRNase/pAp phosphatase (c-di-AMP/oligoRNAs hydrolase)